MPRENLIGMLERYRTGDAAEAEMVARTLNFVRLHGQCLDADFAPGHVTASAWVLGRGGQAVLLTHHRKLGRWFQLGGHMEPGETVLEAALREAREESGLEGVRVVSPEVFDVDVHRIPERGAMPAHDHYDVRFLLEAPAEAELRVSAESRRLAWVELGEVARYNASESILRMVRKCGIGGE